MPTLDRFPLITLTFLFPNPNMIPDLREEENEKPKAFPKGLPLFETAPKSSLGNFPDELRKAGYVIRDASFILGKYCAYGRNPENRTPFHKTHFHCVPESRARAGSSPKDREVAEEALRKLCNKALWRVRGMYAPFSGENVSNEGPLVAMIAFDYPKCLLDGKGNPVTHPSKPRNKFFLGAQGFQILSV